ncbi:fumarylacetoacetate hydrolase family protein [Rhodococcus opacus]|nr:fumarylacetoacetate hydrolase family protein [Rhodococcus opacus]
MLIARIEIVAGPHQGTRTYAEVLLDGDTDPSYLPIADPFDPDTMTTIATSHPIPAEHATLLAPCRPRVILGMAHNTGPADRLLPPQAFHKSPHSVIAPGEAIALEAGQGDVDAEAEVAVVIGTPARNLTRENALAAVFGYTCANDVTDRAAQASDSLWTEAKSRDTYTPLGPWIRTDLDPTDLTIQLGDDTGLGPRASTAGLARGVVDVLIYLSSLMTLHPSDVVLVGAAGPSRRLRTGGISRIIVPAIGELTNPVVTVGVWLDPAHMHRGAIPVC